VSWVDDVATRVLQEHLLSGPRTGQCSCGYGSAANPFPVRELGKPHARHVVAQLRAAGVLKGE
jgi:hypothetical protein